MAKTPILDLEKTTDLSVLFETWIGYLNGNFDNIDEFAGDIKQTISEYTNLAAFPVVGAAKRLYIDLETGLGYRWDTVNLEYVLLAGAGGLPTIGEIAPIDPDVGALWWNSTSGIMYIYYYDGDSYQWVDTNPTVRPIAINVTYDNTTSGLVSTNAQAAIDELAATVDGIETLLAAL